MLAQYTDYIGFPILVTWIVQYTQSRDEIGSQYLSYVEYPNISGQKKSIKMNYISLKRVWLDTLNYGSLNKNPQSKF